MEIGVIGAGRMGAEIAPLFANAGHRVFLVDIDEDALKKAITHIDEAVSQLEETGILKGEDISSKICYTTSQQFLDNCKFVIEAIIENLGAKRKLMNDIEKVVPEDCFIATNSSTYTPTEVAKNMKYSERTILMHFSTPPILRDFVEIAKGEDTLDETLNFTLDLAEDIEKTPVVLEKESRGFISSRLAATVLIASAYDYAEGTPIEEIDASFRAQGGSSGIFEALDSIGLDMGYQVCQSLQEAHGDRFKLPEKFSNLVEEKIEERKLGMKSGEGIYEWENGETKFPNNVPSDHDMTGIFAPLVNEGFRLVEEGVADKETVNRAFKLAQDAPAGVFEIGELFGFDTLKKKLEELYNKRENELFNPTKMLLEEVE